MCSAFITLMATGLQFHRLLLLDFWARVRLLKQIMKHAKNRKCLLTKCRIIWWPNISHTYTATFYLMIYRSITVHVKRNIRLIKLSLKIVTSQLWLRVCVLENQTLKTEPAELYARVPVHICLERKQFAADQIWTSLMWNVVISFVSVPHCCQTCSGENSWPAKHTDVCVCSLFRGCQKWGQVYLHKNVGTQWKPIQMELWCEVPSFAASDVNKMIKKMLVCWKGFKEHLGFATQA